MLASRTVLLRELRRQSKSAPAAPRVLGIDEWAWKKGHRYGTILCDLERGKVIDLLPTRDTATVAAWLSQHPTIEVVSRDRASSFADAIRRGAPRAVQVADRWHLLHNLFKLLARSLERHRPAIRPWVRGCVSHPSQRCRSRRRRVRLCEDKRRENEDCNSMRKGQH